MGQTLTNGVYLPDNGERNCYTGLSQNWQKLDNLLGNQGSNVSFSQTLTEGVEIGKITINGTEISMYHTDYSSKADASNVYTKAEIDTSLSSKADASDLTTHTSNADIHVTSTDKTTWNAKQDSLTDTQLSAVNSGITSDKVSQYDGYATSKANDSDVVHNSGNETISGIKTFSNDIRISKVSPFVNIFSSGYIKGQAPTSNIYSGVRLFDDINSGSVNGITGGFEISYAKDGYNHCYIATRNYVGDTQKIYTVGLRAPNDDTRSVDFLPSNNGVVNLGTSSNKWKTLNGVNPGALSLAGVTRVKVDTTDFVWDGVTKNSFIAEVPCVIYVLISTSKITENGVIYVGNTNMYTSSQITKNNLSNCGNDNNYVIASILVNKGDTVGIRLLLSTTLTSTEGVFYRPLLGNV